MKLFTGAITAIVTPFREDGSVDTKSLIKLVDWQITEGIDGIVVCGSTGEAATLTEEEYVRVVTTVVKAAHKRVPVIAGAGSNDTQKAIHFSLLAKKAGVDGLLHVTPYYNKPTPKGLIAHFKAIADAVTLPLILYNVPGRTGSNVTPSVVQTIVREVPDVVAVKEASGDLGQMMELIHNGPHNISILSGDDMLTLPLLSIGGDGCISVVANEVPRLFSALVHSGLSQDFETARRLHYQLLELMNINFIETNPQPVKTALSLMGKMEEVFRLPLTTMEEDTRHKLITVMKGVDLL